jgi:hypothetical protein
MKIRIIDSSYIQNFINQGFDSSKICEELSGKLTEVFKKYDFRTLFDWEVHFQFIYNNTEDILVYFKGKSYPKEKYKEIVTHIPIPTNEELNWGVNRDQYLYRDKKYLDHLKKNFEVLPGDFSEYTNREDYIVGAIKKVVKFSFEKGFTINGTKVQVENFTLQ